MSDPSFLQRLKERKIVQWTLAYLAGGFVVFQAVEVMAEPWSISPAFQRGVHVLLLIGFLVALVVSWYHGEKGRQRVSGPELVMVASLLVVAGVALSMMSGREEFSEPTETVASPVPEDDRPSIAVLPFDNYSPNPDYAFFASGVQEELTSKLSGISSLAVISRTSVEQYRDPTNRPPVRQIAADLGVDFVIEGSARIGGGSVRITVQLIDARTDNHLWSEDFDEPYSAEDFFHLQAQIAQRIAFHLRTPISPDESEWLETVPTENLEALEAYMRGIEAYLVERRMGLVIADYQSRMLFDQAIELDPRFALAHARLALTLTHTGRCDRARRAAERALSLAGELPEARVALAYCYLGTGDNEEAVRQVEMARQVSPDHTLVLRALARIQQTVGDFDAAIQTLLRTERLDPRDPFIPRALGEIFIPLHRYDDALDAFAREAARSETPPPRGMIYRARIHLLRGDHERARSAISEFLESSPRSITNQIVTNHNTVVLRFMTAEDRQVSFDAWMGWGGEADERDKSCATTTTWCIREAIHEQEVGSVAKAQILWDSLRLSYETAPPPPGSYDSEYTLVFMELGDKEAALDMARTGVTLRAPESCRTSRQATNACTMLARVLARFGEHDEAIDLVEDMLPAPSWLTVHLLEIDPIWDPLRDHPRFQVLLERYADDVEH